MTAAVLLTALTVAFPKAGARLPAVDRTYLIGAVDPVTTNLVINGTDVAVHERGGFVTMVDLVTGTNTVRICERENAKLKTLTNIVFTVAAKPVVKPPKPGEKPAPPKVYEKLKYASDTARTNRVGTIYLDPGHGGTDMGTFGPHGLAEKEANLLMALAVRRELEGRGLRVVMTRTDDRPVELYSRARAAHADGKAAAFVSIHHNAPPYDKDPRVFRYHAVYAWNEIGEGLAKPINEAMAKAFGRELRNNGVIHANFAVTRSSELPSCLIEVDFMTTPEGEADCWNEARRAKIAAAIAEGIVKWTEG